VYPFIRLAKSIILSRRAGALPILGAHRSSHICWPWDIDPWMELNNGRTLTLYDLGRVPMAIRTGMFRVLKARGWGIAVAGVSVRYRRRVRPFQRFEMRSRTIGWDARFVYMEQSMWSRGECSSHMLLRGAITSADGIIAPAQMLAELGHTLPSPALPTWVQAWIEADSLRPWPPEG
jgi:acyl-CoA thioesterase FadM